MGPLARLRVFLRDHSYNLEVYLRITYTVRGSYFMYTGPLARLGVFRRTTQTIRGVLSYHRYIYGVCTCDYSHD
ncbi:hypothetical protein IC582_025324 [Cucumis melo]